MSYVAATGVGVIRSCRTPLLSDPRLIGSLQPTGVIFRGTVRVPRRVFQRLLPERPTPERCVEAYYLQRTRFESIAQRKLRGRQLNEDGNVEISGRDLR